MGSLYIEAQGCVPVVLENLHGGLSVFWQFVEFSLLWSFLAVHGVVRVACQGSLVREACVGVLVGGAGFLLSGVQ